MHPSFDPSTLNEEELREKLSELNNRLYAAHAMGMSYELRVQLEQFIELIEFEQQMRFSAQMQKAWNDLFPDVIESEPDLKPGAEKAKETKTTKKAKEGPERPANAPMFNKVYKK